MGLGAALKVQYLDWWTYKLLSQMYDDKDIVGILDSAIGNWFIIPMRKEMPYNGTAYDDGMRRARNFFLN